MAPSTIAPQLSDVVPDADAFLRKLAAEAGTIITAPEHARIIYELAIRRQSLAILDAAKQTAMTAGLDHDSQSQLDDVTTKLRRLAEETQDYDDDVVSAAGLAAKPAPKREWTVEGFLPGRNVTNLGGDGGAGKSLVALQLAVAIASGTEWFGLPTVRGPVLFLSAEDEMDELHRRVVNITEDAGIEPGAICDLNIWSLAGKDAVLATFDRTGVISARPLWSTLRRRVQKVKPRLVVLDTLADIFGGNEIDRAQTRALVGLLRGLAIEFGCTVLTLSHPSVAGMTNKTGTSSSTAWSNSVRSRL